MAKMTTKNKDKEILCGVIAFEIFLTANGANNLYWFIVCHTPLNLLWAILSGVGFMFFMVYLVAVLAIYRGKQKVIRSLQQ